MTSRYPLVLPARLRLHSSLESSSPVLLRFFVRRACGRVLTNPVAHAHAHAHTGATGFLGAAVLRQLIEMYRSQPWKCYCLVRAADDDAAQARLAQALRDRQQDTAEVLAAMHDGTILAVAGELGPQQFGLAQDSFDRLSSACSTVIHCASHVSHIASYWSLKKANVESVNDILKLTLSRSAMDWGSYSYGQYIYGLCSYGLYTYGLCSYGLYVMAYIVMAYTAMAYIVMAYTAMACFVMAYIVRTLSRQCPDMGTPHVS